MANKSVVNKASPFLASEWEVTDGGLFTIVASDKDVEPFTPSVNDAAEIAGESLLKHTRKFSLGIDILEGTNDLVVKFSLVCEDEKSAKLVQKAMDQLIPLAIEGVENTAEESAWVRFQKRLFENSSTSVVKRGSTFFAVEIEGRVALPLQDIAVAAASESDRAATK